MIWKYGKLNTRFAKKNLRVMNKTKMPYGD